MSLLSELKRRNVIRMAGLYLVGSWLIVQVAGTILPMFGTPDWLPRAVVILLALGFLPILVFAWVFELTPEGLKRDAQVKPEESIAPQTARRMDRMIIVVLALAVVYFGFDKFVLAPRRAAEQVAAALQAAGPPNAATDDKSIAVLPFENLSDEKSNAYFATGIQDEILTRLARIGALRVISRTSTEQYASKPGNLTEIARQLGVANIVEGSVQKAGDAVRVNVQLIRAATDTHLWAQIYDRRLDNLFSVQSEVAGAIAGQLQATLTGDEQKALAAPLTTNVQAHDAWLRALVFFNRGGEDPQGDQLAIQQLTEATRLDPGFAAAWALLSRSHGSQYFQQYDHSDARKALAKAALDRAVELAPQTTETRTAVGYYQYWVERDFAAATRTFSAIEAQEPNNTDAISALGYIARRQGRNAEAVRRLDHAIDLDPRNIQLLTEAAWTHQQGRDYAGTLRVIDRGLNIKPDDGNLLATKVIIYQKTGRLDEAAPLVAALRPDGSLPQVVYAIAAQANLTRQFAVGAARLQAMLDQIAAAPAANVDNITRGTYEVNVGELQLRAGDTAAAKKNLVSARERLEAELRNEPANFIGELSLSRVYSALGDRDAALKTINRAIEQTPISADALYGPLLEERRARIQAHFGEADAAIAALTRLLTLGYAGSGVSVAQMRVDPDWDPLRKDPRFQALLKSDEGAGASP